MVETLDAFDLQAESRVKGESKQKILGDYIIEKKIGSGPLSKIKLAFHSKEGKHYAIKQYNKALLLKKKELVRTKDGNTIYRDNFQDVLNEIEVMKLLKHQNVIKLVEVLEDLEKEKVYIVQEYCQKGQIIDWDENRMIFKSCREGKMLLEKELARVFKQIVTGLEYLHTNNLVHRDIKPQNILECEDGTVKLIDFDNAVVKQKDLVINKTKGTMHFMSPEMCKKSLASNDEWKNCITSDIWALGVTLYCFVFLKLPFLEQSLIGLITSIEKNTPKFDSRPISKELKDLLSKLLEKNPKRRIKLEAVKTHDWFKVMLQ